MTKRLFLEESYLAEAEGIITSVGEFEGRPYIELNQTLFYPQGGGQPGDTGWIESPVGELRVIDTQKSEANQILLFLEANHPLPNVGDAIHQKLDWERRYSLMRMHTCLHLLCSLVPKGVTGGSVGVEKSRLDFDLGDHKLDKEVLTQQINQLICTGSEVMSLSISEAELDQQPDLVRTLSVHPPRGSGTVRLIKIEGIDLQPCGGTHVKNTREIGPVRISKIENKGKRNRRIHLVFDNTDI